MAKRLTPIPAQKTEFKCQVCHERKNIAESVHINKPLCVECFTKIQVWQKVSRKIEFYRTILKEKDREKDRQTGKSCRPLQERATAGGLLRSSA